MTAAEVGTAAHPCELELPQVLLERELGSGSTCTVHLCRPRAHAHGALRGTPVWAVKAVSKRRQLTEKACEHLVQEKAILTAAQHPCIVQFFRTYQDVDNLYFSMELLPRGSVHDHMRQLEHGALPTAQARHYAAAVTLALQYLASLCVLYRDVKPTNVLVDLRGRPKLIDLGLAKQLSGPHGRAHTMCGTRHYLPPEAMPTTSGVRPRYFCLQSDVWALGIFIFEMLNGLPPFYSTCEDELFAMIRAPQDSLPDHPWTPVTPEADLDDCGDDSGPENPFTRDLENLIRSLLRADPQTRATYKEIMAHPWFAGLDWDHMGTGEEGEGRGGPAGGTGMSELPPLMPVFAQTGVSFQMGVNGVLTATEPVRQTSTSTSTEAGTTIAAVPTSHPEPLAQDRTSNELNNGSVVGKLDSDVDKEELDASDALYQMF